MHEALYLLSSIVSCRGDMQQERNDKERLSDLQDAVESNCFCVLDQRSIMSELAIKKTTMK